MRISTVVCKFIRLFVLAGVGWATLTVYSAPSAVATPTSYEAQGSINLVDAELPELAGASALSIFFTIDPDTPADWVLPTENWWDDAVTDISVEIDGLLIATAPTLGGAGVWNDSSGTFDGFTVDAGALAIPYFSIRIIPGFLSI